MIIFSNPKDGYIKYSEEINSAVSDVMNSGFYVRGQQLEQFEKNFSDYLGCQHVIGVGNATDAIFLSLKALDVSSNDEVITVSHTATATASAIIQTGAVPVFIDVNPATMNIEPEKIEEKITLKTKAIIVVHLYGQPCDLDSVLSIAKKYKLPVIEDCAQAAGASYKGKKVGTFGATGCFSFFPTKNLSCYGDGGAISTNDPIISRKLMNMREYGWNEERNCVSFGMNSRLDEIQAAVLNVKLKYLDQDNEERQNIAKFYYSEIKHPLILLPKLQGKIEHVYHLFVVRCKTNRESFLSYLKKNNIIAGVHYRNPIHTQEFFTQFQNNVDLKVTEDLADSIVSLPIYQGMKKEDFISVANAVNNFGESI